MQTRGSSCVGQPGLVIVKRNEARCSTVSHIQALMPLGSAETTCNDNWHDMNHMNGMHHLPHLHRQLARRESHECHAPLAAFAPEPPPPFVSYAPAPPPPPPPPAAFGPPPLVDHEIYRHQTFLYERARAKLNIHMPFNQNYGMFGPLSSQCEGYGDRTFDGMVKLFQEYPHHHKMQGTIYYGWFALPEPFGKDQAAMPRTDMERTWYPTILVDGYCKDQKIIACKHQLIAKTRPWTVDASRVRNYVFALLPPLPPMRVPSAPLAWYAP